MIFQTVSPRTRWIEAIPAPGALRKLSGHVGTSALIGTRYRLYRRRLLHDVSLPPISPMMVPNPAFHAVSQLENRVCCCPVGWSIQRATATVVIKNSKVNVTVITKAVL